jgi:hypothetical protein
LAPCEEAGEDGDVTTSLAQGWYRDPYGIHQDRYFSAGTATKLVRDGGREAYDTVPDRPLPEGDLVPAHEIDEERRDRADLRRADDASAEPYDPVVARRAALDVFDRSTNW